MLPSEKRRRGQDIEVLTAHWLTAQGLTEIARNQHARGGEIDLIMRDGETLVFVEVRYRATTRYGSPLETVTVTKQRRLIKAARFYLANNRLSCSCRFDVVGVTGHLSALEFTWIKSAFDAF
ncbi:YraN family protein [Phytohalomonas tamaricis]|uniref:YraN family protein n=1 Tax=Phytohalomonas tamaricis TaxID=2081032 RepID=UPI000D0AC556|nr:YraN family protein [Phytohalomonas tamaricis]